MYISPAERPERMIQGDREKVPYFESDEWLYIRYLGLHWIDGQLDVTGVPFPAVKKTSVNRGSLSEPEDVLFSEVGKYNGMGVLGFRVREIPTPIDQLPPNPGPTYHFWPEHVPLELNFSHSEIWSKHEHTEKDFREPSDTVKAFFRTRLAQVLTTERILIAAVDTALR